MAMAAMILVFIVQGVLGFLVLVVRGVGKRVNLFGWNG
jgi:hypothetical protein